MNRRLETFYSRREQPYAGFLPQSAIRDYTFSALKLLCGKSANESTDWRTCATPEEAWLSRLRSRVVVIGEDTLGVDQHETVIGTIPGVLLQANYVEAILNDDLFRPVPTFVDLLYSFIVFAVLQWIVIKGRSRLKLVLLGAVVVAAYGVCWVVIELFGFYLNPGVGLVAAILSWLADLTTGRLVNRQNTPNKQRG